MTTFWWLRPTIFRCLGLGFECYRRRFLKNWIRAQFCSCSDCRWWRKDLRKAGVPPPFMHPH